MFNIKKNIVLIFCLLIFQNFYSQSNFEKIDIESAKIKYKGDLNKLVNELTDHLDNKIDKTRAIYIWITENIAYDVKKLTKKREGYKCKDSEDCRLKKKKNDNKIINRILKNKKGICSGYALLFHRMCNMANIESASINGYIKNSPSQVGKMGNLDHAWNTVTIDNQIYYLDLTWAAGGVTKKKKYLKNRNDYYWFTPIEKFSLNHFPEKTNVIYGTTITKEDFKNTPYINSNYLFSLNSFYPEKGILKLKLNDTIFFKINIEKKINTIQINNNLKKNKKVFTLDKNNNKIFNEKALKNQEYMAFNKKENEYNFIYVINNKNLKYIEILFDYEICLKYKVLIE
jgi:transglutaminase/protease-like cytokinesis protein 3